MTQLNSKLAGGITAVLVIALILFITMQANEKMNLQIPERVSNFISPQPNLVAIEAFDDHHDDHAKYYEGARPSLSHQMYQQAVNAATPTMTQLDNISNLSNGGFVHGVEAARQGSTHASASVNYGNRRSDMISASAQNAPNFVASSLLPKTDLPGVPSWDVVDTVALAHQDFLSPAQQFGTDTISSSLRNASYDIRDVIPNPVQVVSPWMNSTMDPEITRKSLNHNHSHPHYNTPFGASLGGFK